MSLRRRKLRRGDNMPKKTCCVAKSRCARCPIRMLNEGTLPPGYTVKKRKLVRIRKNAA